MEEEASNFNLFEFDEDLAHQSSCARIPEVDLLGPLGGDGHRGKGQGGNDQGERQGDGLPSQGPLWQDREGREREPPGQRQRSLDLLGDVLRGSHGEMSQLCNVEGAKVQSIRNVEEVVKETIGAHVDFLETVTGTIKVGLEVKIVPKFICKEKNSVRNPRKSNQKTRQVQRWSKI